MKILTSKYSVVLFTSALLLLYTTCSNSKKAAHTFVVPEFEITYGRTGGFSNINPVYKIKSNGEVLKSETESSPFSLLRKLDSASIDSLYALVQRCNFATLKINETSNLTKFIAVKSGNMDNKITWYSDDQIPAGVLSLYQFITSLLKK